MLKDYTEKLKQDILEIKQYAKGTRLEYLAERLDLDDFDSFIYLSDKKLIISNLFRVLTVYKEGLTTKLKESLLGFIDDLDKFNSNTIKLNEMIDMSLENSKKLSDEAEKASQLLDEYKKTISPASEVNEEIIH